MNDAFDFDLDLEELAPADAASEEAVEMLWSGDLTALSHHHTKLNARTSSSSPTAGLLRGEYPAGRSWSRSP